MSNPSDEVLLVRIALLERRLQLVSEELASALARLEPNGADAGAANGGTVDFAAKASFDADSLSQFAHGFYPREYDQAGKVFRWTGNGPLCELRFFINRDADRTFRMGVGTTASGILSQLTGFVDYATVPLAVKKDGPKRFVTGTVPKRTNTRLAVVTFMLGAVPTKTKKVKADDLWLGFQFYSFSAD
jgi:hypothetical protein